jgi:hypothetical protein
MTKPRSFCHRAGLLTVLLLFIAALDLGEALAADDAQAVNERAWDENLNAVIGTPAARYGFYAYRSIAVLNPEVYLEADDLVADVLEDMPGTRLAYRSHNARDVELFLRLARRETKGGAFSLGMLTLTPDSIYDARFPNSAIEWLTMRAPSIAVMLKPASPHLTTFESALLRYAQLRRAGHLDDNAFIVVDRKGAGYLATDSTLSLAGLSDRAVGDWKDISPVLVFNRRSVFSVLSGRDDLASDSVLAALMSRLGSPAKISMKSEERARFDRLRKASALWDRPSQAMAVLVASGLADRKQPLVDSAWSDSSLGRPEATSCRDLLLEEAMFWANRLSPRTAQLATRLMDRDRGEGLDAIQSEYLAGAGRRVSPNDTADLRIEAWGCIWSYDLFYTAIDDNVMTRAGSSHSQATAMSAVLDLAGIEHFQLGVQLGDKQIPDQQWLFTDNGRHQFNLGIWTVVPDSLPRGARPTNLLITGFTVRGAPTRIGSGKFCAQMDNLAVSQNLTSISRQMPLATLALMAPTGEVMPFQKFLVELTGDRFQPVQAEWPQSPSP